MNPAVNARSTYLNTFDDVAAGREAAIALIRVGADMLHHNADQAALGAFQAVKESPGVYIFGSNLDQKDLAPDRVLGSAVIDLPRAFLMVAREVKAGGFRPKVESFGLRSGVIRYEPNPSLEGRVPEALRSRVVGRPGFDQRAESRGASLPVALVSDAVLLAEVVSYLDDYLRIADVPDDANALNGLQVENSGRVGRLVAAVDASQATIDGLPAASSSSGARPRCCSCTMACSGTGTGRLPNAGTGGCAR